MNNHMQDGMAEATRLMREGRLVEATAIIQRSLGEEGHLGSTSEQATTTDATGKPFEAFYRVVDEAPHATANPEASLTEHVLRPVPKPPQGFRRAPRSPGGLPGNASRPTESGPTPEVVPAGGRFVERSFTNQAGTRADKLYIPSGYVSQAAPLVAMLHGCTQNPNDFAAGTR